MDLRNLPDKLSSAERCSERRTRMQDALGVDLSALTVNPATLGNAEEKNCEQMFGSIPLPVGYAGPLDVTFSSKEKAVIHLPLATTEGALVASVNRGCKAVTASGGVRITSTNHGISRSIALKMENGSLDGLGRKMENEGKVLLKNLRERSKEWVAVAEGTSDHLKIITFDFDASHPYIFLTLSCDTDEAMGMNMATIAAQAVGEWIEKNIDGLTLVTVAGNVDSDKKPSKRTHDRGRGYEVIAEATLTPEVVAEILKTSPATMAEVADAKLQHGSMIAGSIGANLHAANIIAALYLATGQDAAHVVEGSLADTEITIISAAESTPVVSVVEPCSPLHIRIRLPAILIGVRGGGTTLPAQAQCLEMLLKPDTALHPCRQLAESIGAAVLAGEVSLLAAQASHDLAKAHKNLGR